MHAQHFVIYWIQAENDRSVRSKKISNGLAAPGARKKTWPYQVIRRTTPASDITISVDRGDLSLLNATPWVLDRGFVLESMWSYLRRELRARRPERCPRRHPSCGPAVTRRDVRVIGLTPLAVRRCTRIWTHRGRVRRCC